VGILIYEMMIGVTPFYNRERKLLLLKIRQSRVVFPDKNKYKIDYSDDFVDLVMKLLDKNKQTRLGSNGKDSEEILAHPFFKDLDYDMMMERQITSPLDVSTFFSSDGYNAKGFNQKSTPQDL